MGETPATPVAVIGMGCRLPGGIDSPEQLWQALLRGDDLVTEIPGDRWDAEEHYDPDPSESDRSVSRWGAFIDDVMDFDAGFFGISEPEASAIDPQHRLLLETAWEAVEHAGIDPTSLAGSSTAVFAGLTNADYSHLVADVAAGSGLASTRIAHALGVTGPAATVDSACSSSLLAVHLACRSLQDGTSDMALAGGASVLLDPRRAASLSAQGLLSPTGRCRAFDASADGFVSSEASAVVLLKRLPDAIRDGDRVLAVIRGTATNHTGRTPSPETHVALYRAALASAEVDASTVGMVEAHGVGRPVDDHTEFASLAQVYGVDGPCALGSVKTNLGHTHSASGVLGLIKTVLSLQQDFIPANLHFDRLPNDLTRVATRLSVPQELTPWADSAEHPRRAAVSSHGLSGTNVHAIVERAPETVVSLSPTRPAPAELLFPLSATDAEELRHTSRRLADWLAELPERTTATDLGYTLARRRAHRPTRAIVVAGDVATLMDQLRDVADGDTAYHAAVGDDAHGPVWVFSAQSSAWTGIGTDQLATEPAFTAVLAEAEPLIAAEAGFSVTEAVSSTQTITEPDRLLPIMFTVQVAAARALQSYGVQPGAVIGYSLGEVAAAVVAGALSLQDGVRVITRTSRLMKDISGAAGMASVDLPAKQVLSEFASRGVSDVAISAVSSLQSTVVGGPSGSVDELMSTWRQRGIEVTPVDVDVAWNSPQVDPILSALTDALTDLTPSTPTVPYYSATLFDPRDRPDWDAWYWTDCVRYTVRFAAAVQAAIEDGFRVFAEPSPHPWLGRAIAQTADSLGVPVAPVDGLLDPGAWPHALRNLVTQLHGAGAAVDFSALYPDGRLVEAPLPSWSHQPLLLSRGTRDDDGAHTIAAHPLLGPHVRLHEDPERHAWQGEVSAAATPWLSDHRISDVTTLPGAAYCEMALAAARTVFGDASEVRDAGFERTPLSGDTARVFGTATVTSPELLDFAVEVGQPGTYTRRCTARLAAEDTADAAPPPPYDIDALLADHPSQSEGAALREWFDDSGVHYGPAYTGLATVRTSPTADTVVAEIALPGSVRSKHSGFGIHPALLDACFQAVLSCDGAQSACDAGPLVPTSARRLRMHLPAEAARYCYARIVDVTATELEADLDILDRSGATLMSIRGLRFEAELSPQDQRDRMLDDRLLAVNWRQGRLPDASDLDAGTWLLVSTSDAADLAAGEMTNAFKTFGAHPTAIRWSPPADDPAGAGLQQAQIPSGQLDGAVVLIRPQGDDADAVVAALEQVKVLTRIVRELTAFAGEPPRLYVVTKGAQAVRAGDVPDLQQAGLRGLMRVVAVEQPHMRATLIDTDDVTDPRSVTQQVISGSDEDMTAWRDGTWFTARVTRSPLRPDERRTTVADHERDGIALQRTPGDVESLEVVTRDRVSPGVGQIEVAVAAAGLNAQRCLGTDFAGVVTAIGAQVDGLHIGDRVGGIALQGSLGTFVTCDGRLVAPLPASLADGPAAGTPSPYVTAWHCLHDLAGVSETDTVLIHAATSGVGLAAIAVARAAGAEVFATAASPSARELLQGMGITHVYDSGDMGWADLVRGATDGRGIDVVINSLTGAAHHAGMRLVSPAGHFIDIERPDTERPGQPGPVRLQRNISVHSVDLNALTVAHPQRVHDLLATVYRSIADGVLPPPACTQHAFVDAAAALRVLSTDAQAGDLVVDVPRTGTTTAVVRPESARVFRSDGSYIITGGLSRFGLSLAATMAEAGCGRIVLTAEGEPEPDARDAVERMQAGGADIAIHLGDIAESGSADRAVAVAVETGLPVRGVLHAAATPGEATVVAIDDVQIESHWAPKVYGAWHLHQATAGQPLDWFCAFSSVAALLGAPGQGADAAADSWLDTFALWRRSLGFPATTIAWGQAGPTESYEGVDAVVDTVKRAHAFETLLRHDRPYTGYAAIESLAWLAALANRGRFVELVKEMTQRRTGAKRLRAELTRTPRQDWNARLIRLLAEQIGSVLHQTVLPDRPLFDYGLDSLANLEVRTRIETETGVGIAPTDLTTVRELAAHLCDELAVTLSGTNFT